MRWAAAGGAAAAGGCPQGHRLELLPCASGERGCDGCGGTVCAEYTYHCTVCDYDLCAQCQGEVQCAAAPRELECLAAEYAELEASGEEEAARSALALQDAKLMRVKLQGLLQRLRDRTPSAEEVAERYEAEIDEVSAEVRRLKEENALLAVHGVEALAGSHVTGSASSRPPRATSSRSPPVPAGSSPHVRQAASQAAATQMHEEAAELWRCQAQMAARRRRTQVDEWYLERLRSELQGVAQTLRGKERELAELQRRREEAEGLCRDLSVERAECSEELERERRAVAHLHRETLSLREACYVPAQMKRKSCSIMRFLDQEGGRLNTEKHMRGVQAVTKLYNAVSAHAPSARPLAARAKAAMEEEFARYQRLEQRHTRALQQLHLSVTRDVLAAGTAAA